MRIPINDLEEASRDPGAYVRKRNAPTPGFFSRSKYYTLQLSVFRYHKLNEDLNAAHRYLEEQFLKHFKQRRDLPKYVEQLETYARGFTRLGTITFKVQDRLSIPIDEAVSDQFKVSGEIPRLDLTSEGYTAWLFSKKTGSWREELRLPLIQHAYAESLSVPVDEMKVGIYDFSTGSYTAYGFNEKEIEQARRFLSRLLSKISQSDQE